MGSNKNNLVENILTLADKLFRQLLPSVPKELLTLDVTMPQTKIMLLLYINGPMRMSDIASELDVTLPTATSLVDRIVEKNYVLRETQSGDRRVVLCRLSEPGQKAIGGIWASARNNSQAILERMDITKLQMLIEVLEAMMNSAYAKGERNMIKSKSRGKT